jgi:hypothetical protein
MNAAIRHNDERQRLAQVSEDFGDTEAQRKNRLTTFFIFVLFVLFVVK